MVIRINAASYVFILQIAYRADEWPKLRSLTIQTSYQKNAIMLSNQFDYCPY
ncbi:hypothetical protein C8R31_103103 [Nitrosospira sp. Nsp2]|nr:hypothetical protein C8R31_103103 [Nitrosospira sp. Nsp2]